jgi:hypothetical protein
MDISDSLRDSSSGRSDATKRQLTISQPEQRQSQEPGNGRRRNEPRQDSPGHPERDQGVEEGPQVEEVDRPDLELNYQGNSLVIDMSRIEWIALAIIIASVASTIYIL